MCLFLVVLSMILLTVSPGPGDSDSAALDDLDLKPPAVSTDLEKTSDHGLNDSSATYCLDSSNDKIRHSQSGANDVDATTTDADISVNGIDDGPTNLKLGSYEGRSPDGSTISEIESVLLRVNSEIESNLEILNRQDDAKIKRGISKSLYDVNDLVSVSNNSSTVAEELDKDSLQSGNDSVIDRPYLNNGCKPTTLYASADSRDTLSTETSRIDPPQNTSVQIANADSVAITSSQVNIHNEYQIFKEDKPIEPAACFEASDSVIPEILKIDIESPKSNIVNGIGNGNIAYSGINEINDVASMTTVCGDVKDHVADSHQRTEDIEAPSMPAAETSTSGAKRQASASPRYATECRYRWSNIVKTSKTEVEFYPSYLKVGEKTTPLKKFKFQLV